MSKSTLNIHVPGSSAGYFRTVEAPCRLPEAFNFKSGGFSFTADLSGTSPASFEVSNVESEVAGLSEVENEIAAWAADAILADAKRRLGLLPMEGRGDVLPAIALAYEAECASHNAQFLALQALPRALQNPGLVSTHPSERESYSGGAVGMLAQYVAWVFEQACDAQTERAEQAAKVTP